MRAGELERLVQEAERFYALRSLPAVFQISAATGAKELDEILARRGYAIGGASEVWTMRLREGGAHQPSEGARRQQQGGAEWSLRCDDQPDDGWFDCAFDEAEERRRVHEQIVRRVPAPRLYVAMMVDGVAAGCGMANSARGYTGIFCMATRPAYRRRGIGLALVHALCAWSGEQGDQCAFLQVMAENQAAKGLYQQVGFGFEYGYHYRVK